MAKKPKETEPAFYDRDAGEFRFACDEHDEIEILVFNCTNRKEAAKKVQAFLEWLRTRGGAVHVR